MSDSPLTGTIEFIASQELPLTPGDYTISTTQTIEAPGIKEDFTTTQTFSVFGPRFELTPQDIHSVFPPPGSRGDHNNVLPHIILNRSTLPWERDIWANKDSNEKINPRPWLALLVFYEEEKQSGQVSEPKICTLEKQENSGKESWVLEEVSPEPTDANERITSPEFSYERAQNEGDKVTVIDVQKSFLKSLLPTTVDLQYLAHVRQRKLINVDIPFQEYASDWENNTFSDGIRNQINELLKNQERPPISQDYAIDFLDKVAETKHWVITDKENNLQYVICRKIRDNAEIKAVLNVFTNDSEQSIIIANRLPKNNSTTTVHLVSLADRYGDDHQFSDLENLGEHDFVRLVSLKSWSFSCLEPKYNFTGLLKNLKSEVGQQASISGNLLLRLPKQELHGTSYIDKGYVPLPHYMRKGDKTISWYHGPFVPWKNTTLTYDKPVQASDQLLHYDSQTGLFDVSYASAWQLGRMLALQNKRLSVSLFNWKRSHLKNHHKVSQFKQCCHLIPQTSGDELAQDIPIPLEDQAWFERLNRLEDIPFNYLVPDERMLPNESIRFFWVDPLWVDCLLKGAFSIGETCELTHQHHCQHLADNRYAQMTGILLRSEVVAGYPGLLVDGYGDTKLPLRRMERLSENVLLCLFDGEVTRVDIYQKAETLHFGLKDIDGKGQFSKELKNENGQEYDKSLQSIPFRDSKSGVVNIDGLATTIKRETNSVQFTSAQFALQMVEGTSLVKFTYDPKANRVAASGVAE